MRISFKFTISIGASAEEPAHIEDHTGYIADAGTPIGFERKEIDD